MRVLILSAIAECSPSGIRQYYQELARELRSSGHFVDIRTQTSVSTLIRLATGGMRRLLSLGTSRDWKELVGGGSAYLRLAAQCRSSETPDIVHAQDQYAAIAAIHAFRGRVPVVFTCQWNDLPSEELRLQLGDPELPLARYAAMLRACAARVSNWIFPSEASRRRIQPYLGDGVKRIVTIPNGIDFEKFGAAPRDSGIDREFHGRKRVAIVGRLEPRKNQQMVFEVASALNDPSIVFLLAGDGPDRTHLESVARARGLSDRVIFLGHREPIAPVLRSADLCLHLAHFESFGISLIEAVACGIPVLARGNGAIPEVFARAPGGIIDPAEDGAAIAARVRAVLDSGIGDRLRRLQHEALHGFHSLAASTTATLEFYREVIGDDRT